MIYLYIFIRHIMMLLLCTWQHVGWLVVSDLIHFGNCDVQCGVPSSSRLLWSSGRTHRHCASTSRQCTGRMASLWRCLSGGVFSISKSTRVRSWWRQLNGRIDAQVLAPSPCSAPVRDVGGWSVAVCIYRQSLWLGWVTQNSLAHWIPHVPLDWSIYPSSSTR